MTERTGKVCACGCGAVIEQRRRPDGRPFRTRKYATDACRQYAYRLRHRQVWGQGQPRQNGRAVPEEPDEQE